MICPICNGRRYQVVQNYDGLHDVVCPKCNGIGFVDDDGKPMQTNEEWLKSLDTEQLAEALLNIMANNEFTLYLLHTEKKSVQEIKGAVFEWLKEKHTND